jgi:hypothetical protein
LIEDWVDLRGQKFENELFGGKLLTFLIYILWISGVKVGWGFLFFELMEEVCVLV